MMVVGPSPSSSDGDKNQMKRKHLEQDTVANEEGKKRGRPRVEPHTESAADVSGSDYMLFKMLRDKNYICMTYLLLL